LTQIHRKTTLLQNRIKICGFGLSLKLAWLKSRGSSMLKMPERTICDPYCTAPEIIKYTYKFQKEEDKDEETKSSSDKNTLMTSL